MWPVILISLVTSSVAFTTHRYDAYDSFSNYRPNVPRLDNIFKLENSNGRRPVQTYDYIKRFDGVVISDVYEVPVVNSDGDHGRVHVPYDTYKWVVVTESPKVYSRFENPNPDTRNTRHNKPFAPKDKEENVQTNQRKPTNQLKPQENVSVANKQNNDFNNTLVINEQQITWNNEHQASEDNANITTRSINSANNSNTLNAPSKHSDNDNVNHPQKRNDDTVIKNDDNKEPINTSRKYSTKTTQDNEVTPSPHEQRTKAYEEDRWIWSDGSEQVVETTTVVVGVDDRAAFTGKECPQGAQKVGDTCVVKD